MESANLHHQLQDQFAPAADTSSLSTTPSCYGAAGSSHSWAPDITLNAGNFNQNFHEAASRSERGSTQKNDIRVPPINGSMIQDLGYHWTSDAESCLTSTQSTAHDLDLQFSKIKEEISDTFPKFTEMLNGASSMEHYRLPHTTGIKNEDKDLNALSEKLLLKTLSAGDFYSSSTPNYPNFNGMRVPSRGNFSQIYPSINISNLNQTSSPAISSSLDMNMQSLDLLTSAKYNGGLSHRSQDGLGRFSDSLSFRLDHMQQPTDRSSSNSSNASHFTNGMAETKRPSALIESKASQSQTTSKKSRLESRPSCPPFKVRKEKLGDRIAALQQLVAPFGKTDTASVLMEAIGYIKFLQNQVETLSVPYMKSSRKHTSTATQEGLAMDYPKEEPNRDLRSRGLCLVPLSCMSYITGEGGSGVWQQPNFGGAT